MVHPYHEPPLSRKRGDLLTCMTDSGTRNSIVPHTKGDTLPSAVLLCYFGKDKTIGTENRLLFAWRRFEAGRIGYKGHRKFRAAEIFYILIRMVVTGLYSFVRPQRTIPLNAVCLDKPDIAKDPRPTDVPISHGHGHGSPRVLWSLHFSLCLFSVFPSILR